MGQRGVAPIRIAMQEIAGSIPACPTNAKAMCGAWLGAYALPGRLDPANLHRNSLFFGTPERRGRGGRNPATSEHGLHISYTRGIRPHRQDGLERAARTERIRAQISAHKVLALEKPRNRIGNTDAGQPLVIGLNAKAEAAA